LSLCGFGFWSHDIGGFEGTAPAYVYKRWAAFGLLSSLSRLHGSSSYRVPWAYDEAACDVVRFFTKLKLRLMPYLWAAAVEAHREGVPMMRAMILEFPDDPACDTLDRQYMMGASLLVAPVFSENGSVNYYLPSGRWVHALSGEVQEGGRWHSAVHDFLSLPLFARAGSVLPWGGDEKGPDYDTTEGTTFRVYDLDDGAEAKTTVYTPDARHSVEVLVKRTGPKISARLQGKRPKQWAIQLIGVKKVNAVTGAERSENSAGVVLRSTADSGELSAEL
jgi:alpha-D-xyloside xylohydrolase